MCGRTACALDPDTICKKCQFPKFGNNEKQILWSKAPGGQEFVPKYNLAPGDFSPILICGLHQSMKKTEFVVQVMQWGLIPSFAELNSVSNFKTFNARLETLMEKKLYSVAMKEGKRCVVIAQGFFEWKNNGFRKQPYFLRPTDPESLLMMAGVFSYHTSKQLYSYAVITTNSVGSISNVHSRMPVIFSSDKEIYQWLDHHLNAHQTDTCFHFRGLLVMSDVAYEFLQSVGKNLKYVPLSMYPVTSQVNNILFNSPECIMPVNEDQEVKKSVQKHGSPNLLADFLKRSRELKIENDSSSSPKIPKKCTDEDLTIKTEKQEYLTVKNEFI